MKSIATDRPERRTNPRKGIPTPDTLGTLAATKRQRAWVVKKAEDDARIAAAKAKALAEEAKRLAEEAAFQEKVDAVAEAMRTAPPSVYM